MQRARGGACAGHLRHVALARAGFLSCTVMPVMCARAASGGVATADERGYHVRQGSHLSVDTGAFSSVSARHALTSQ